MNQFQTWYRTLPTAIRALLTINVVLYVLWLLPLSRFQGTAVFVLSHLALNPEVPGILFEPWQLITYNFLHLGTGFWGFLHILFNMLWLVWVGRDYEQMHGPQRLLAIYLIGGLMGGLLTVILHNIFPSVGAFGGPVQGASASVLAVMMCVAITYPYKSIALLFIGTVRLLYVVLAFLVLDILFSGNTSISAHLGGALAGFLFAKAEQNGTDLSSWAGIFFRSRTPRRSKPRRSADSSDDARGGSMLSRLESWLASRTDDEAPPRRRPASEGRREAASVDDNSTEAQVDRILEKISEQGYDALTEEEKRILYEASQK
ncbi:MAG: rhomboid family intramembrane serine protease [Bacteroidota bacterium]